MYLRSLYYGPALPAGGANRNFKTYLDLARYLSERAEAGAYLIFARREDADNYVGEGAAKVGDSGLVADDAAAQQWGELTAVLTTAGGLPVSEGE